MSITAASASDQTGASSLACPYCTASVPTTAFDVWPKERRLATGTCPGCDREITVPVQWVVEAPRTIRLPEQSRTV